MSGDSGSAGCAHARRAATCLEGFCWTHLGFGSTGPACLEFAGLALVDGLVGTGVADVAVPLDERGIRLDDVEFVRAAYWGGHGDVRGFGRWLLRE